ncbi:transposase [Methylobacterium sp. Leaf111]|uniref:transposase n=1 Tax=Methylobacterium sp. Leaf111 TaxID=1736257 RepID=UPI00138F61D1|nr:transposase [Methylobacterium sp. Leaf111]
MDSTRDATLGAKGSAHAVSLYLRSDLSGPRLGASLVMPRCTTSAMAHHLEEISATVAPGAYAVLLLDQAGWHTTRKLLVPGNITLLPLPARSPELNPVEKLWQFMRDN